MGLLDVLFRSKTTMVEEQQALGGRSFPLQVDNHHAVLGVPIKPPFPPGTERAIFGMGCFWGAERLFWELGGVHTTAVGYSGGFTPNPTYEEVCSGRTGHTEAVLVVFRPADLPYEELLRAFWEAHNPTQAMRQGYDLGTQYRSAIYTTSDAQAAAAAGSAARYQGALSASRKGEIATEIAPEKPFFYAETYHQQYLAKVPGGYCGLKGTGVSCPVPTAVSLAS